MALLKEQKWKLWLLIAGAIVVLLSTVYSYSIAKRLIDGEERMVQLIAKTMEDMAEQSNDADHTAHLLVLEQNKTVPVILVSANDQILYVNNFGQNYEDNPAYFDKELKDLKAKGAHPDTIRVLEQYDSNGDPVFMTQYLYYKNSFVLQLLTWFPLLQLLLITSFVLIGYWGISSDREAEQNRVWAGLAKETAHQLGTPISALIAWLQLLESSVDNTEENQVIINELKNDVARLELISDRFSKVGSEPILQERNIKSILQQSMDYMKSRAPRQVRFVYEDHELPDLNIKVNGPLFEWVIENLLKNALDAMDKKGNIVIDYTQDGHNVYIDISDTGKGIPSSQFKKIFEPGYSTKKRGWGLGLSLAKRIIEQYHKGKIYVKDSAPDRGTTFTIELPKSA